MLQDIFILLRGDEATFQLPSSRRDSVASLSWIGVTHVCQYWRHAALSHKRLWCIIRLGPRTPQAGTVGTTFLRRSFPLPITLHHDYGLLVPVGTEAIPLQDFYAALQRHPERIHGVFLSGVIEQIAPTTLRRLLSSTVELSLSFYSLLDVDWNARSLRVDYIDELLGEPLFTLRKLHLSNCTWPANPFPSLTHLYLTHEDTECNIETDMFYDFLDGVSQHLQVLYLNDAAVYEDHDSFNRLAPVNRIHMRALEHIEIIPPKENDKLFAVLSFLCQLSMPPHITIVWHASDIALYLPDDPPWYTVPPPEHCDRVTEVICTSLREGCFAIHGCTLYFSPDILGRRNGLQKFGRFFPNVRSVTLLLQPQPSGITNLAAVLPGFPAITSLHIQCPSNYARVRIIHWLESRHQSTTICPNLVDLTFHAENHSVVGTQGGTSCGLGDMGLQFPEFPSNKAQVYDSVVRSRQQFGTTYTVRYPTGTDLDVLLVEVSL